MTANKEGSNRRKKSSTTKNTPQDVSAGEKKQPEELMFYIQGIVKGIIYNEVSQEKLSYFEFVPEQKFALSEDNSQNHLAVFLNKNRMDARLLSYRERLTFYVTAGLQLSKLVVGKAFITLQETKDSNCKIKSDLDGTAEFDNLSIVEYGVLQ